MDMNKMKEMMGQAQQMQQQMEQTMAQIQVEGSAGGGAITVRMNGKKQVIGGAGRPLSRSRGQWSRKYRRPGNVAGPDCRGRQ